jgi:RNA polymerase sigma-70 factor (ECF subfamily)
MARPELLREDRPDASVELTDDARETLDALAREHRGFLLGLARKLCRSHLDPEDLVQEVLVRTAAHWRRLPEGVNHRAWMTQVMKNLFVDQVRRLRTQPPADGSAKEPEQPRVEERPWWDALDANDIRAAMSELPDEQREVFERFAFRNESYQVIAEALAIPKATVGTRILRARRRLKELLERRRT